ncbi:hypothetical protein HDU79_007307 [Rhizoclosmatium sp. JEL0117]|nr:hypothetical protein HDU79_007307 [Rhizoclosmatium sp. JEL0117]
MFRPVTFSATEAAAAFARAKRSQNNVPVPVAKTFYYETYRRVLSASPELVILQNNNLTAHEFKALKLKLKQKGFVATQVRNAVLSAAVRDHFVEEKKDVKLATRFARLLVGPSIAVFPGTVAEGQDLLVRECVQALAPENLGAGVAKKILVAGALLEQSHVLSRQQLEEAAKLPSKQRLRVELVGLLSSPAARLAGLLSQQPQSLVRTLQGRV